MTTARQVATRDVAELRTILGRSTALWAGAGGLHVEAARWTAFSGAPSVDYNVALVHGPQAADLITTTLGEIAETRVRALVMMTGEALGDVQRLVEAGWVCVGAVPLMTLGTAGHHLDPAVRRAGPSDEDEVVSVVCDAFDTTPDLARVAVSSAFVDGAGDAAIWGIWDDGTLTSCMAAVTVDGVVVVWSMATPTQYRRRGYGRRLLTAVLADAAAAGVGTSLLHASAVGTPFYRALGYEVLEWWQLWSRPRWVFGRT